MTELLERAIAATRSLDPDRQDEAARFLLLHAGQAADDAVPIKLTDKERAAIEVGLEAAERGDFASDEEMRAIWAICRSPNSASCAKDPRKIR